MKILAVTACPTGIAHTYMAAEAIADAAKKKGYDVKVETRGSVGVENELTADEIKSADAIILACDTTVPMERFGGKKVLMVGVSDALKDANGLIEKALNAPCLWFFYQSGRPGQRDQRAARCQSHRCLQAPDERRFIHDPVRCGRWYHHCPELAGWWY